MVKGTKVPRGPLRRAYSSTKNGGQRRRYVLECGHVVTRYRRYDYHGEVITRRCRCAQCGLKQKGGR